MPDAVALVPTERPARYLKQLVGHFSHKIETELADDGSTGSVTFGVGTCRLSAEPDGLRMIATAADDEALAQLEDVVARHLIRFGAKDELVVTWSAT